MTMIMMYHSIDESGSPISISPASFKKQMEIFSSEWNCLSLGEITKRLRAENKVPDRSVVITFDDGFKNFLTTAYPVIQSKNIPVTVFPVTGYLGKQNHWPGQPDSIPKLDLMTETDLVDLLQAGIDFGAHSHSHPWLTKIGADEAFSEIKKSKEVLQEILNSNIESFAYPYGDFNPEISEYCSKMFTTSLTTRMQPLSCSDSLEYLPRIDAYFFRGHPELLRYEKIAGGWAKIVNIIRSFRNRGQKQETGNER